MPGQSQTISAARFSISIDSVPVGWFEKLTIADTPNGPRRSLLPHELAHVVQQGQAQRRRGHVRWMDITLERGVMTKPALSTLQAPPGRRVTIEAATGARITLLRARIESSSGQKPSGNDIAMEKIELVHEGFL
jgi:hypothetical protein